MGHDLVLIFDLSCDFFGHKLPYIFRPDHVVTINETQQKQNKAN